ncbi:MAG TPA: hypothetical protein VKZ53_08040 [Candidatus Angelobacter sp.]|nr:hypothetical protein [Candidatus Angelobacter sp.]
MSIGTRGLYIAATIVLSVCALSAQQVNPKDEPKQELKAAAPEEQSYLFELTITEMNGKQKINTRKVELVTSDQAHSEMMSYVPVPSPDNPQMIGLTTDLNFTKRPSGELQFSVLCALSFFVPVEGTPADESSSSSATKSGPIAVKSLKRSLRLSAKALLKVGVPTKLAVLEDVASTHSYELSVLATPK